jgi:hypothetical protein
LDYLIAAASDLMVVRAVGVESEMELAYAMIGQMPYTTLRTAIFTHPTAAEGLTFLLSSTPAAPPE